MNRLYSSLSAIRYRVSEIPVSRQTIVEDSWLCSEDGDTPDADFDGAEFFEVRREPLGIEEPETPLAQMFHQREERDLGRVAHVMKHRLAEKGTADRDAVKAARQLAILPGFDGMRVAESIQASVTFHDLVSTEEKRKYNLLRRENQHEGFIIIHAFAEAAKYKGEQDFAISQSSLANRLNITPPGAAFLIGRLIERDVIKQTRKPVRYKEPGRYAWTS